MKNILVICALTFVSMGNLCAFSQPSQFGTTPYEQQNLYNQQESLRLQRQANSINQWGY